ncbi:cytochrome b/b6 domain-containing protein [Streptomyces sp. HC44]|uniref:Cytochrome b/b6 domain-containing protein n=1 Tax=Streptomyces scabichelini TaxID=2711217 RepID=A0A6G4V6M2_9ACTN|nr:cytochrome b/b6 domain-containing protein [Streptomyces scabichelini]
MTAAALLLIPLLVLVGGDGFRDFLNFGAGVLSLVALTCSVVWGLVATDRVFLDTRQRLIAQAVHRTTAVSSVAFLLLHITAKIALDHTTVLAALIPFSGGVSGPEGLIGFGSLAGLLMIFTALTGALRSAFASPVQVAARWRAVHMLAYPAWCSALVHGLFAGRPAATYVTVMYSLTIVAVGGALALRAAPLPFKRKVSRRVLDLMGSGNRPIREEPPARRATADSAMAGAGSRPGFPQGKVPQQRTSSPSNASLYDTGQRSALTDTGSNALTDTGGFAAAYRAVSNTGSIPRVQDPLGQPEPTQRMQQVPMDMQPTESLPRVDDNAPRWPAPSPPLYEAPPRPTEAPTTYNATYSSPANGTAYDMTYDTGSIPAYGTTYDTGAIPAYGSSDLYDTGETNDPLGTYNTNDTYDSGPATETLPGAFDAPSSGEPWNAPSGGF